MKIAPEEGKDWESVVTDVFFDEGQIVMEIKDLEIRGSGEIESKSGSTEILKIRAPIELCQLVITPEQEMTNDGILHPKFEIADAVFQIHKEQFYVDVTGDMPLFKEARIEKEIKEWLNNNLKQFENDFKAAL